MLGSWFKIVRWIISFFILFTVFFFLLFLMSTPSSPSHSSSPGNRTADEELEAFMREETPALGEDDELGEEGQQGATPSAESPSFDLSNAGGIEPSSGPVRSNKQCIARQLAVRSNLHAYQKEALDDLVKVRLLLEFNHS